MRHVIAAIVVSVVAATISVGVIEACGAKFLVASRSARLQKLQRVAKPAHILLYQYSDDPKQDPAKLKEFTQALSGLLEKVGHQVTVADSEGSLREAARSEDVDVVMMQIDAARRLRSDLGSWAPRASVLPIAEYLTRAQVASVKEEFGHLLKVPATTSEVLSTVQDSYRRN